MAPTAVQHQPILAREAFDAVQAKLAAQAAAQQCRTEALLAGKLYDHLGHPMTPSHAVKGGVRYRYYISRPAAAVNPCFDGSAWPLGGGQAISIDWSAELCWAARILARTGVRSASEHAPERAHLSRKDD
jgi:hypothetical protein